MNVINYVLTNYLFHHVLASIMRWNYRNFQLFPRANMLPLTPVLMLDIFGSSNYFQPVLKILIISVLRLDIFGSSDYFQPVLEIHLFNGAVIF